MLVISDIRRRGVKEMNWAHYVFRLYEGLKGISCAEEV